MKTCESYGEGKLPLWESAAHLCGSLLRDAVGLYPCEARINVVQPPLCYVQNIPLVGNDILLLSPLLPSLRLVS